MLLALNMMAGCVDRSYAGMEDEDIFDDTTEPIPVKVHIGSAETIVSKGSGVMGDSREWQGAKFFVYAFNNDMLSTYNVKSKDDSSRCLIDGSKDVPGSSAGKEAYMSQTSNIVSWSGPDDRVYYPFGSESGIIYDFFAYYVDDVEIEEDDISRTEDRIVIRVEIDGSQDLMSSKARVLEDQLAGFLDEKERLYMEHYCYSYYAARKGIDPVFVFKHHLTKLDFMMTPAYNITGKRKVNVKKIEVRTMYRAQFTVADKVNKDNMGLVFDEKDYANLALRDEGADGLTEGKYVFETLPTPSSRGTAIPVGLSILVAPDARYEVYAYMTEEFEDGTVKEYDEPLRMDITHKEGFQAGNGYKVNISVYGATRLDASVSLEDWNSGGKVTIDDEESFGNNGEY